MLLASAGINALPGGSPCLGSGRWIPKAIENELRFEPGDVFGGGGDRSGGGTGACGGGGGSRRGK